MMDYKYIEQLLQSYWQCETTVEEEQILRSFFCQKDVPAHLRPYAPLFVAQSEVQAERMPADFEARLQRAIEAEAGARKTVRRHPRLVLLRKRIAPMLQAVAIVAVCLTIGNAAERALNSNPADTQTEAAPTVANTYVKSSKVAETLRPANQRTDATANAATATTIDSLARSSVSATSAE